MTKEQFIEALYRQTSVIRHGLIFSTPREELDREPLSIQEVADFVETLGLLNHPYKRFEYKAVRPENDRFLSNTELEELGKEGWEICEQDKTNFGGKYYYCKREIL